MLSCFFFLIVCVFVCVFVCDEAPCPGRVKLELIYVGEVQRPITLKVRRILNVQQK